MTTMKKFSAVTVIGTIIALLIPIFIISAYVWAAIVISDIPRSHIEGNVPDEAEFQGFLTRDLEAYFSEQLKKPVSVQQEMLHKGTYQAGVGDPKYYAWVRVADRDTGKQIKEGVAYVAAKERTHFFIIEFIQKENLSSDLNSLKQNFPSTVAEGIERKLKE